MGGLNINRRRFMLTGSVGFGVLAVLLAILVSTGSVMAAIPIAGIGGFEVSATKITGTDFELIPALTDGNNGDANPDSLFPVAQNYMGTSQISGFTLSKEIDLDKVMPGKKALLKITTSGTVEAEGVIMYVNDLVADNASFTNLVVDENYLTKRPATYTQNGQEKVLTDKVDGEYYAPLAQASSTIVLTNPQIKANYMKQDKVSIPGMRLNVKFI